MTSSSDDSIGVSRALGRFARSRFADWLNRRLPAARRVRLDQAKLFVFPSKLGFAYLGLLAVLWLLATNYQNNLVLGTTFLLGSLFITAILHSYANLAGLELAFVGADSGYAGRELLYRISVSHSGRRPRQQLKLCFKNGDPEWVDLVDADEQSIALPATAPRRGWFNPGRVTLESSYPLGLLRVWTHLDLDCEALVYPQPRTGRDPEQSVAVGTSGQIRASVGSDDFAGLSDYQPGEPLQHVAWKQYARGLGLHSKQYADAVDERLWLDWNGYPGVDRENRLQLLCGQLLKVSSGQAEYGLRLPGIEIGMGRGEAHRQQILRELALFELGGQS